jgi:hypothetical protein
MLGGGSNLSPSEIDLGSVDNVTSMSGKSVDEAPATPKPKAIPAQYDGRDDIAANPVPGSVSLYTPMNLHSGYGDVTNDMDGRSEGFAKVVSFEEGKSAGNLDSGGSGGSVGTSRCLPSGGKKDSES